jgi:hypothetical protein
VNRTIPFPIYRSGISSAPTSISTSRGLGTAIPVWLVIRRLQPILNGYRTIEVSIPSPAVIRLPRNTFYLVDPVTFICIVSRLIVVTTCIVVEMDMSILVIRVMSPG